MDCYQKMYYKLFNKVTDVIGELQKVQRETEEMFLSFTTEKPDNILHLAPKEPPKDDGSGKKPPKK
jgi:hypothetical protein